MEYSPGRMHCGAENVHKKMGVHGLRISWQPYVGDEIVVVLWARAPFVIRKAMITWVENRYEEKGVKEQTYEFVGECYVPGVMDGKALDNTDEHRMMTFA